MPGVRTPKLNHQKPHPARVRLISMQNVQGSTDPDPKLIIKQLHKQDTKVLSFCFTVQSCSASARVWQGQMLRSGIEALDPGSRKAQTASFLTLVSWGRWIWEPQSDGACCNTMNMSFIYAVTYLMVTSLRSYKKLTCLICCSNSYFSKKTGINIDVNVFNVIPVTNATPYHEFSHDQNHLKYVRKI